MQDPSAPINDYTKQLLGVIRSLALASLDEAMGTWDSTADMHGSDAPRLPRFAVGEIINGRYEVLRILGKGSMGVVYQVRDQLFPGRRVALKTMQRVTDPKWLALFRAEFQALAELRHAHIAEVYDFEELAGGTGHLFTMELVDGQELDAALRGGDIKRVWRAVTEMAEALAYVHSHGRLHLDIKPSNAILAANGSCKLLDFGLVGLAFTPGQFAGTPLYMAPEIVKEQLPDARCDLFSLGVTAYQLLTGSVPYSRTAELRELLDEKLERSIEFSAELHAHIPAFMRQAVQKLCALRAQDRFASARDFLNATGEPAAAYGAVARTAQRLERSAFVGNEAALARVIEFAHRRMAGDAHGAVLCCVGASSGMGKSRLLAEARTRLQSDGHTFLQGDAYDQDVGKYTALLPILLAASLQAHAQGAEDLIQQHGPELVKIVPAFGLPIACQPSPAFSNGEAESARLVAHASAFLVELAQRRPLTVYLNDLQWAGEGTLQVLHQILTQLRACPAARLALLISYRSDQVGGQPLEELLARLPPRDIEPVSLQALSAAQVGAMMSSMLLAAVDGHIADQMQQATGGVPFLVEESTRWLVRQGRLALRDGLCVTQPASAALDLQVEVGRGIVARAAMQGREALLCLQLLAVCARPLELDHLRQAMGDSASAPAPALAELSGTLLALESEQFVVAVAGNRPLYALAHDRIRESLFAALDADERAALHGRLGRAFETFLRTTDAAELAVLAAVHHNATPAPTDAATRTSRCEVNLRAADLAMQAADFPQALAFLDAAESLLLPELFADHARGMRLCNQRARTFGAMLNHGESLRFAQQAVQHARTLLEEGQALILAIRALTLLRRYDEAVDLCLNFCNRLNPRARLPGHPGPARFVADLVGLSLLVQRVGAEAILRRVDAPEEPARDLVYEMFMAASDALYFGRPMLFARFARYGVEFLLREGASAKSFDGAMCVMVLCALTLSAAGRVELAIEVGRVTRRRMDRVRPELRGRFLYSVEGFLRHLDEPMRSSPPLLLTAAVESRQARDTAYEGYSLLARVSMLDWLGEPIDEINTLNNQVASTSALMLNRQLTDWIAVMRSLQPMLQVPGDRDAQPALHTVQSKAAMCYLIAVKLRGMAYGVWPGPCSAEAYGMPALLKLRMGGGGIFYEGSAYFFAGLVYLAALRGRLSVADRLHFRAAAEYARSKVRTRARYNPTDFAHRVALHDAEQLRNRGALRRSLPIYEESASLAQANGWPHEAALILEKRTEVLAALGDREAAHASADASLALYQRWQAWAKVAQIQRLKARIDG